MQSMKYLPNAVIEPFTAALLCFGEDAKPRFRGKFGAAECFPYAPA